MAKENPILAFDDDDRQIYLSNRAEMRRRGIRLDSVQTHMRACCIQRIARGTTLMVLSDTENPLSSRERSWIAAIAAKLTETCA